MILKNRLDFQQRVQNASFGDKGRSGLDEQLQDGQDPDSSGRSVCAPQHVTFGPGWPTHSHVCPRPDGFWSVAESEFCSQGFALTPIQGTQSY